MKELRKHGIPMLVSHTTRPAKTGEQHGVDYYFVNSEQFAQARPFERVSYNGYLFGMTKEEVAQKLNQYPASIVDIDRDGFDQLKKLIGKQTEFAVLSGAVGDGILESLLDSRRQGRIQLVLRNGAALFCSSEHWRRFSAAGGSIRVVEPIRLLAVTLNPVSPTGGSFNDGEFFHRMSAALAPLPVFDLVQSYGQFTRNLATQESK